MPIKKIAVLFLLSLLCFACQHKSIELIEPQVIPVPNEIQHTEGVFYLNKDTYVQYPDVFKSTAEFLESYVAHGSNITLGSGIKKTKIIFEYVEDDIQSDEAYTLRIQPKQILIQANDEKGGFYAVQTLRQLLPAAIENSSYEEDEVKIPCVIIKDQPRFSYRGMHLDVGRHMYSVEFIKKYIDALAMLKMNTFHWHLTEDQGWRIEIKKYPKLQEIAAFRDETLVGHYSDQPHQFDGKRYGGYYSQEDIKAIVAYAKKRHVTIIPEIEMPGHSQAAIAAYPELGCTDEHVQVATKWGIFEHIYCPKEETFEFLQNVLDEVLELFPSEYIHIGGDEAPKNLWKTSQVCQNIIEQEGLKDEHELQNYFITRIETYLNSKGRQIIGWDEILEGGLAPNATVMSWRGVDGAIEAAKQQHNVVMTPTSHCYFDYYQSENENEPLAIGGYLPLEKVYSFNPIPDELTNDESKYVLGAQGNIWTEYMPAQEQVEYMAFPRMIAMSEVVWSSVKHKNYTDFVKRLESFYQRLEALDINYANHLYEVNGELIHNNNQIQYQLETLTDGKTILFTIDGSEPDLNSEAYKVPVPIIENTIIKARISDGTKVLGTTFSQQIDLHKAVGAKISIDKTPHKAYAGSGAKGLINGILGSNSRYGDKEWLGFWGEDIEVKIDFDEPKEINSIETRFHNGNGQWIYAPNEIHFYFTLDDGSLLTDKIFLNNESVNKLVDLDYKLPIPEGLDVKIKTIIIGIPNYGNIKEGNQGAGNKAWTFIDEIIVK